MGDWTKGHNVTIEYFGTADHLANIAGHAAIGCAMGVAQGGGCKSGAASAAVGAFVTPLAAGAGDIGGFFITTIAGGTASVASGGKFANGAATAAMGYLFNQVAGVRIRLSNYDRGAGVTRGTAEIFVEGEETPRVIPITTGRGTSDASVSDAGPTPEGGYFINPSTTQNMNLYDRIVGNNQGPNELSFHNQVRLSTSDWGAFRSPLSPYGSTNTFGRNAMYIHGGSFPGSAGCVDVGNVYDKWLMNQIRQTPHLIPVNVVRGF